MRAREQSQSKEKRGEEKIERKKRNTWMDKKQYQCPLSNPVMMEEVTQARSIAPPIENTGSEERTLQAASPETQSEETCKREEAVEG